MTGYTLYLCEKPDQARIVAKAIGGASEQGGYITAAGNVMVTYGFGHLVELMMPQDYDPELEKWGDWGKLPIIPAPFRFKPRGGGAAKQLRLIGTLLKDAARVVIATDPDREGELIAYLILNHLRWKGPTSRLWIDDLTQAGVQKALKAVKAAEETKPLYHAALARSCADWTVGINMTRGATMRLRKGPGKPLSIGRVQTPTLALIVRNHRQIVGFKPENYYELTAQVATERGHALILRHAPAPEARIKDRQVAEALAARARGALAPLKVTTEAKTQAPPPLFDLNALQQEMNGRFGWSAKKTLATTQALYEQHHYLSYPRTDCPVLPADHAQRMPQITANLLALPDLAHLAPALKAPIVRPSVYNDAEVKAHYAIVPTLEAADLTTLSADEKLLYLVVARRFLAAHLPDHQYLQTVVELDANGVPFRASGRQPTVEGWKAAFAGLAEEEPEEGEEDENAGAKLPPVQDGERSKVRDVAVDTKTTKPPARFTEKTLLRAMKNIAQYVEDAAAKKRLKATSGIGTSATRDSIIETLKDRDYIRVEKKKLIPTEIGIALIDVMEQAAPGYCDPAETAAWEDAMEEIVNGKVTTQRFIDAVAAKVRRDIAVLRDRADLPQIDTGNGGRPDAPPRLSGEDRVKAIAQGTVLKVPYDQRDKAKKMGAIWDNDRRCWVAPPGADLAKFKRAKFIP